MTSVFLPMLLRAFFTFFIFPVETSSARRQAIALPDPGEATSKEASKQPSFFRKTISSIRAIIASRSKMGDRMGFVTSELGAKAPTSSPADAKTPNTGHEETADRDMSTPATGDRAAPLPG